jgi:hypothetical protein
MGGQTLGGSSICGFGVGGLGSDGRFGGGRLGGMRGMGGGMGDMSGLTDSLLSRVGNLAQNVPHQASPGAGMFGPGFSRNAGYGAGNGGSEDKSGKNDGNSQDTDSNPRTGT